MGVYKSLDAFIKEFNKIIEDAMEDADQMEDFGEEVVEMVRKRTRLGYGADDAVKYPLKSIPHSQKYKDYRKSKAGREKLNSNKTSPTKQNLTLTGEMLDDLQVTKVGADNVEVGFKKQFAKDKAEWNHDGTSKCPARPFMSLTKQERKRLTKSIEEAILKKIKK